MNKMAMFVEGRTELEFDCKLIEAIANQKRVTLDLRKIRGNTAVQRRGFQIREQHIGNPADPAAHFILILDCGNDVLVKTRMQKEYDSLLANGYSKVICHRDVRAEDPAGQFTTGGELTYADLPKLESHLPLGVRTKIPVTFVLSVMEVEAWFLAEHSHYAKIDPAITIKAIQSTLGFDPVNDDLQVRQYPARDLNDCYKLGGKEYLKHLSQSTIDVLNYDNIYLELAEKLPHLGKLRDEIEAFLALP